MDIIKLGEFRILDRDSNDHFNPKFDRIKGPKGLYATSAQLELYLRAKGFFDWKSQSLSSLGYRYQWKQSLLWAHRGQLKPLEKNLALAESYAAKGKLPFDSQKALFLWNHGVKVCMEKNYGRAQTQARQGEFFRDHLFEYRFCAFKGKVPEAITIPAEARLHYYYYWQRAHRSSERGWVRGTERLLAQAREQSALGGLVFPQAEAKALVQTALPKGVEVNFKKAEWFARLSTHPDKVVHALLEDAETFARLSKTPYDRARAQRILRLLKSPPPAQTPDK